MEIRPLEGTGSLSGKLSGFGVSLSCASTLCLLALLCPQAKATNLIVNGSFDVIGTTTGGFTTTSGVGAALPGWTKNAALNELVRSDNNQINCVVPGSAAAAPTTICGSDAPEVQPRFSLWQAPGASPNGGNYYLADGWSTFQSPLAQTVSGLQVGMRYSLTFWQASAQEDCLYDDGSRCDPPGNVNETEQWQVTFGSQVQTSTLMSTPIHTSIGWNQQTMYFTAASTSQLISFLAEGTPANGPPLVLIDGIDLEMAPEPAPSSLLGIGLLLIPMGKPLVRRLRKGSPQP